MLLFDLSRFSRSLLQSHSSSQSQVFPCFALFLLPLACSRWCSRRHWWCLWCIPPFFLSRVVIDCSRRDWWCSWCIPFFLSCSRILLWWWSLIAGKFYPRLGFWRRKTPLRWPILVSPTTVATCSMKTLSLKR